MACSCVRINHPKLYAQPQTPSPKQHQLLLRKRHGTIHSPINPSNATPVGVGGGAQHEKCRGVTNRHTIKKPVLQVNILQRGIYHSSALQREMGMERGGSEDVSASIRPAGILPALQNQREEKQPSYTLCPHPPWPYICRFWD